MCTSLKQSTGNANQYDQDGWGMYKAYRDICRADFSEFEDAVYQLQEEYLKNTTEEQKGA